MTVLASSTSANASAETNTKGMTRTGWAMSGLVILFILFDAVGKLIVMAPMVDATRQLGYPVELIRPLGVIALVCTLL
jgi:hypothetical protein